MDVDGDGHCDVICGGDCDDCDDGDGQRFPGNPEVCDVLDRDEDCDGRTFASTEDDVDGDGYFPVTCCNDTTTYGLRCGTDCDDASAYIYLGATEICNYKDDDCDGVIDGGSNVGNWQVDAFADVDRDGWGTGASSSLCPQDILKDNKVTRAGDCADDDPDRHPDKPEICNGIDDNCNGVVDEGFASEFCQP